MEIIFVSFEALVALAALQLIAHFAARGNARAPARAADRLSVSVAPVDRRAAHDDALQEFDRAA